MRSANAALLEALGLCTCCGQPLHGEPRRSRVQVQRDRLRKLIELQREQKSMEKPIPVVTRSQDQCRNGNRRPSVDVSEIFRTPAARPRNNCKKKQKKQREIARASSDRRKCDGVGSISQDMSNGKDEEEDRSFDMVVMEFRQQLSKSAASGRLQLPSCVWTSIATAFSKTK